MKLHLFAWPDIVCGENFNIGNYLQVFSNSTENYTCSACRHHWLLPLCITVSDRDLCRGLRCFTHFTTDRVEIWCAVQAVTHVQAIIFAIIFLIKGNICRFTDWVKQHWLKGMHLDAQKPVWISFTHNMIIDTTEPYIFILCDFENPTGIKYRPDSFNSADRHYSWLMNLAVWC